MCARIDRALTRAYGGEANARPSIRLSTAPAERPAAGFGIGRDFALFGRTWRAFESTREGLSEREKPEKNDARCELARFHG